MTNLSRLEDILQYTFTDKTLLEHALTHSSYAFEKKMSPLSNNERLEFLGDAVLQIVMSTHLYNTHPKMDEGDLSRLRAKVVCEDSLAYVSRILKTGPFLILGRGEEKMGGHDRDSILADSYEAILGAIYLDGGLDPARDFIFYSLVPHIDRISKSIEVSDYKTALQEEIQKTSKLPIKYLTIEETGPAHDKRFVVEVTHNNKTLGKGSGRSKKDAEQQAARAALTQKF